MIQSSINIGDFNLRVTFYTQSRGTRDAYGNYTLSTGTGVPRWANVSFKPMKYNKEQGGLEYLSHFEIIIRQDNELLPVVGGRVDFDSQELQIMQVDKVDLTTLKIIAQGIE